MRFIGNEIQVTVIYSRTILVAVAPDCCVKMVICKTWTWFSDGTDPVRTLQNVESDQGLHSLLKLQEVKGYTKQSLGPV